MQLHRSLSHIIICKKTYENKISNNGQKDQQKIQKKFLQNQVQFAIQVAKETYSVSIFSLDSQIKDLNDNLEDGNQRVRGAAGENAAALGQINSEMVVMLNLHFNTFNSREQIVHKIEAVD